MNEDLSRLLDLGGVTLGPIRQLLAEGDVEGARDQFLAKIRQQLVFAWSPRCGRRNSNVFELIDLDRPELDPVKQAWQVKNADGARAALQQYFRDRPPLRGANPFLPVEPAARQELREKALRGELDAAMVTPVRNRLHVACQAHALTGARKFVEAIERLMPVPREEPRLDELMDFFYEPAAVDYLLRNDVVDFRRVLDLVVVWYHYTEQVNQTVHLPEPSVTEYAGNHYFWMLGYALLFAMLFPEFKRAEALTLALWARYADEMSRQVAPDGTMIELVPGYENCCIWWTTMALHFARANGVTVPDLVYRNLEKMYEFELLFMRPDRRCPALGDSENDDVFAWHKDAPTLFPKNAIVTSLLQDRQGSVKPTSVEFPYAGYYAMRSGWEPEALYLMLDAGRFGQGHHHEDKLHFELMAYGRPFLVDAGRFTYDDTPARRWAVVSAAHNTILVDGVGQCRWRSDRLAWYNVNAPVNDTQWQTTAEYDFVAGKYDLADGPFEKPLPGVERVERAIRFQKPIGGKPGFWIVSDVVQGSGRHSMTALFHFHPDNVRVVAEGRTVRTMNADANLLIVALGAEPVNVGIYRGQTDPFRGWFSSTYGSEAPAYEAEFHCEGEAPLRRGYLLLPYRGATPEPSVLAACKTIAEQLRMKL